MAHLFARDIQKYLEMGGDIRHMTFDTVYRLIDPKKDLRKGPHPTYSLLGVRGDDKNESRI